VEAAISSLPFVSDGGASFAFALNIAWRYPARWDKRSRIYSFSVQKRLLVSIVVNSDRNQEYSMRRLIAIAILAAVAIPTAASARPYHHHHYYHHHHHYHR
jgi:hypothetical protein